MAVRIAAVEEITFPAVTTKLFELAPCGIVTLLGKLTAVLLELESTTIAPPDPAGAVSVTVPVPDCPLARALGLTDMLAKAGPLLIGEIGVGPGVGIGLGAGIGLGVGVGLGAGVGSDDAGGLMVKLADVNETPP